MNNQSADPAQWKNSAGLFGLLLLAIFVTELAVMEMFSPLFSRLGPVTGGLLDAGGVVLLCTAPIWFFLFRMVPADPGDPGFGNPWLLLVKALAAIFAVEFLVMLALPYLLPGAGALTCDIVDASLTALVCAIPIWRVLFRPELRRRIAPVVETPLRLYVLLLCSIFLSDLIQGIVALLIPAGFYSSNYIVDAFLTTLFGAPMLWLMVARPLRRAARSEQARVAAVYSQVIDAIVVINPLGEIRSFNPAAEKLFGFSAEEMIGSSAALLLEGGGEALEELMQMTSERTGEPRLYEFNCLRRDGSAMIMNLSISELLQEQTPELLLIMRDITSRKKMEQELRESETRFRQIFHQSEDAILFFKPGGCQVLDANAKAERVFGYSKQELREGAFEQICSAGAFPDLSRAIGDIGEGSGVQLDLVCRRQDQQEIIVSLRGKRMTLQGDPITFCSLRDITERVRMEERTRDIQARLIQTNKMTSLGLLVSGVAHEINNPNNFIMANCALLEKISEDTLKALDEFCPEPESEGIYLGGVPLTELGEHTRRLIGGIATGSRRVNDIVNNLKGFARQELNQPKREVDLSQVARAALSLMHHELIKFTDNFHLELAERLPPVAGHSQQLGQVIINLLMNACQALPGRECGIWLSTDFDPDCGLVSIAVRDEGHGMSRDDSHRVLEPFYTTKLDSGGTGLGLSISDSIIKEHGGTLEFSSEPGRGTTFVVRIPALPPEPKEQTHEA
jgi:PAS domain S-box-containing protein